MLTELTLEDTRCARLVAVTYFFALDVVYN